MSSFNKAQPLFEINNLVCSYSLEEQKPALKIEHLVIEKGKVVFLLGASGSGKSTLLETLGLMNQTIASGEILFYQSGEINPMSLNKLWDKGNESLISKVRKENYSFIFQNTNLMENFSAYQNVCLSKMIKEDKRELEVLEGAKTLMHQVKLPLTEVGLNTLAVNLSGGQRQRVAFVRALNSNFNVLFGDEPTGNLDESNAHELFDVIRNSITEEHSAIIVSHDINLAVAHADVICVITKDIEKGYGEIKSENIFYRENWIQSDSQTIEVKQKVKALYRTNLDGLTQQTEKQNTDNTNFNYRELFFRKEAVALLGRNKINLWILSLILFFTFLAIGFANGSLNYLKNKLDSAFVNWLVIEIPSTRSSAETVNKIYDQLNEVKTEYDFQKVSLFKFQLFFLNDLKRNGYYRIQGRTVDLKNDNQFLSEFVLNDENILLGDKKGFRNDQDLSVIVKAEMLSDFNYPENASFIYINKVIVDSNNKSIDLMVPIPIRAIVKDLPGQNQFLLVENFSKFWKQSTNNPFDITTHTDNMLIFFQGDSSDALVVKNEVKNYFKEHNQFNSQVYQIEKHHNSFQQGFDISVNHLMPPTYNQDTTMFSQLLNLHKLKPYASQIKRQYAYNLNFENTPLTYDEISVYFNRTDKIRNFSKYVMENFNNREDVDKIVVDTVKVKDKENFNFLSKITYIICYLLVLFATIAVCLFIFNIIKMHLNKVKMNIGTFKAIGMGDNESRNIYFQIILMFIIISLLIGLIVSSVVGLTVNYFLMGKMLADAKTSFYVVNHLNTYITIFVMLTSTLLISWVTINKILMKSPGDLIYNR